ncbi:hypothetical protein [Amycolatopsis sp. cmx-4-54]|uniref:hypothetical protein n=1 Tax=Amycolatopsis sp. cmx-4-54 TaxID=2790936 RepID=UPI00397C2798
MAQKRVDDARVRTVGKVVAELIPDRRRAEVVTSLGLAMPVGYRQVASAGGFTDLGEYTRLVLAG